MREMLGEYGTLMICVIAGMALLGGVGMLLKEGGSIYQIAVCFFKSIGVVVL